MDFTGSRGRRDTGTLGRYLCTRIDRTGRWIDVGLLVGKFKVERRIKGVIQVSGPGNLLDSGATDSEQGTKEKEQAQRGTRASEHAADLTQITFAMFFSVISVLS